MDPNLGSPSLPGGRERGAGDLLRTPRCDADVPGHRVRRRPELRRDRQSLETARQRRRELEVEASLAGVPEAWRHPGKTPGDGLPQKGR